jgi:hypothetical protein
MVLTSSKSFAVLLNALLMTTTGHSCVGVSGLPGECAGGAPAVYNNLPQFFFIDLCE